MILWEISFKQVDGTLEAQRPFHFDGDQDAAETAAREFWHEFQDAPVIEAYALAQVDENGCHATDGQRLLHHDDVRAALEREALTLERNV